MPLSQSHVQRVKQTMLDVTFPSDLQIQPLSEDRVDLWQIDLNCVAHIYAAFLGILSPDEISRANRFRKSVDRARFVNTRGTLRTLLGRYLGIAPIDVVFVYNSFGKPLLSDSSIPTLFFNVSHSMQAAAIAVSNSVAVGIDWEFADRVQDPDKLANVCLSSQEMEAYRQLSSAVVTQENAKMHFLLERWTLKEAYLKGIGAGLSCPLSEIDLQQTIASNERQFLVHHDGKSVHQWHLRSFTPDATSYLALAVESRPNTAIPMIKFHTIPAKIELAKEF